MDRGPDEMLGGYHGFVPQYLNDAVSRLGFLSGMMETAFLYKRIGKYTDKNIYKSALKQKFRALFKSTNQASNNSMLNLLPYDRENYVDRLAYLSQSPETFDGMLSHL